MTENDIIVQDKEYKSNITIRNSISIKNKLKNSKILFGNRPIFHKPSKIIQTILASIQYL